MKQGILIYDNETERLNIKYADGSCGEGFHCGDTLSVLNKNEEWVDSRVEYNHSADDWYLAGLYNPSQIPCDLSIKI